MNRDEIKARMKAMRRDLFTLEALDGIEILKARVGTDRELAVPLAALLRLIRLLDERAPAPLEPEPAREPVTVPTVVEPNVGTDAAATVEQSPPTNGHKKRRQVAIRAPRSRRMIVPTETVSSMDLMNLSGIPDHTWKQFRDCGLPAEATLSEGGRKRYFYISGLIRGWWEESGREGRWCHRTRDAMEAFISRILPQPAASPWAKEA